MTPPSPTSGSPARITLADLVACRHGPGIRLPVRKAYAPMTGTHRTAFRGRGMAFDETRAYQPGDEIRNMDWRVTARTGRPHIKLFCEEREQPLLLWIDLRPNMFFATRGVFKSVMAARIASRFAWHTSQNGDRVGGLLFSGAHHQALRPKRGEKAVLRFLRLLTDDPAWDHPYLPAASGLLDPLLKLREVARPGSRLLLLSDFRGFDAACETHLIGLSRHCDGLVVFIFDPLEAQAPPPGWYPVGDGDRRMTLATHDQKARERYHRAFERRRDDLEKLCRRHGLGFMVRSTADEGDGCQVLP